MSARRILCLAAATALLVASAGCIFSPEEGGEDGTTPPPPEWKFAGSPKILMDNFMRAYEEKNWDRYVDMLHPTYQTILQQETIDQFPDVGATLTFDEEVRIHKRMFSGDDLEDPVTGALVPGVIDISFREFRQLDDWLPIPVGDEIVGDLFAPFQVDFLFDRGQEHTQISVKGQIRFYVIGTDSLHEGSMRSYYQMVGQVDLTAIE